MADESQPKSPLPRDHPMAGCQEKLWRALEHFETLQAEIGKLKPEELVLFRTEPKPGVEDTLRTVVDAVREPDLRLATILGDMVHNLRSSLDHLVFELAFLGLRGKSIPARTAFPGSTSKANWNSSYVQHTLLEGITQRHRAMLYRTQPCYRKRDSASARAVARRNRSPSADLHDLWNDDKHRMIQPVVVTPYEVEPLIGPWHHCRPRGDPTLNTDFLGYPMKEGTEILTVPVQVTGDDPRVTVRVKMAGETCLRNGFPVLKSMSTIGNWVQAVLTVFTPIFETPAARRLWVLPRGGWVEREPTVLGRTDVRGWRVEPAPPQSG